MWLLPLPLNFHSRSSSSVLRAVVGLLRGVVQKNVTTRPYVRAHEDPERTLALGRSASGRHAGLTLAVVAICMMAAYPARAELNLRWDAPPSCPRRGEVLDRIRALAGSSLDNAEGLSAEGRIARTNGRFSLTLLVRDGRHLRKRVITSDSCADLGGAAAITLALLLGVDISAAESNAPNDGRGETAPHGGEPDEGERNARAGGETRLEQQSERGGKDHGDRGEEPAERGRSPEGPATPGRSSTRGWNLLIRAPIVAADLGPLPDPSVGVGLGAGIGYESWRFVVAGHVYRGQAVSAMDPGAAFAAGADLDRITAHLAICRGWRSVQFEIAPCVGLAVEYLTAGGFGQGVSPELQSALWAAPSAGAAVHWYAMKSLVLFVGANGDLELSRPRIIIEGLGEVRQLGPVSARITAGVEWIL